MQRRCTPRLPDPGRPCRTASATGTRFDRMGGQAERRSVKHWFSLLLFMGALLGLLGQEAAIAHVMPVETAEQTAAVPEMSADCAEMMGLAKREPQPEEPCQGTTP